MAKQTRSRPTLGEKGLVELKRLIEEAKRTDITLSMKKFKAEDEVYRIRKQLLMTKPDFWFTVLTSHEYLFSHMKDEDLDVLKYLVDIWVSRNSNEPRAYCLEFTFAENPIFMDRILKKEFRYIESDEFQKQRPDAQGFRWAMLEFDWNRDIAPQPTHISWRSDKNLCQRYPPIEKDGSIEALGSLFNWFCLPGDPFLLGMIIAQNIFPNAANYYRQNITAAAAAEEDGEPQFEDLEEEEEEEEEEEVKDLWIDEYGGSWEEGRFSTRTVSPGQGLSSRSLEYEDVSPGSGISSPIVILAVLLLVIRALPSY